MKKRFMASALAVVLAGCGQLPQGPGLNTLPQPTSRAFVLNGLQVTPVRGFPDQAWRGLPRVRSAADLVALRDGAYGFAYAARHAAEKGNMELAILNWTAAQHLAAQGMTIAGSSLGMIRSIDANGDAMLPARGLAIIPTQPMGAEPIRLSLFEDAFAGIFEERILDWAEGVKVAGGDEAVLRGVISDIERQKASGRRPATRSNRLMDTNELPLNTPVMLTGGMYVERRDDVIVFYNSNDKPSVVPLSKIGYVPPLAPQSRARQAAAPVIRQLAQAQWEYGEYWNQKRQYMNCEVAKPNRLNCSGVDSLFFDGTGRLAATGADGARAYQSGGNFKAAMDILVAATQIKQRQDFRRTCVSYSRYFNERIVGPNAEIKKMSCLPTGQSAAGATTTDLFLGENGAVKTYTTLMNEKATRDRMEHEARLAGAWSDSVSYIPVVGAFENGAKCVGADTSLVQEVFHTVRGNRQTRLDAALAGWNPQPPTDSSVVGTAINCLGTVPLAGTAAKGLRAAGSALKNQGAFAASAAKLEDLTGVFRSSLSPGSLERALAEITTKYPGNAALVDFTKGVNSLLRGGEDMSSTIAGLAALGPEYVSWKR